MTSWQGIKHSELDGTMVKFKSNHFKFPNRIGAVVGLYLGIRYYVRLESGYNFIVSDPTEWLITWKDDDRYKKIRHPFDGSHRLLHQETVRKLETGPLPNIDRGVEHIA